MTRNLRLLIAVQVAVLACLSGTAKAAPPEFKFVSESAVLNPQTQEVTFTLAFNQAPDFSTTDLYNRQGHSFQYFIVGRPFFPYPSNFDSIIRGEEIHLTHDNIRIRNSTHSDVDPASGGWGTIRGVVPFKVNGNLLTFSAPLRVLSDHSNDGSFDYRLESYEYGSTTNFVDSRSVIVPRTLDAQVDVKPRTSQNHINPRSRGMTALTRALIVL